MYFKNADYKKRPDQEFTTCDHNTCSIPNHMVIADERDAPEITITYKYKTLEDRTRAEIIEIIKAMNRRGKLVSKVWVCKALNFGERKGDDFFAAIKRDGLIVELQARRHNRNCGTFYRIAGNKWKRLVQKKHALMRRELNGTNKGVFKNSPKGSLAEKKTEEISCPAGGGAGEQVKEINEVNEEKENNYPNYENLDISSLEEIKNREETFNDSDTEKEFDIDVSITGNGFVPYERKKLKKRDAKSYPDGSPGDGLNGTQYTMHGCFDRLISFNEEADMIRRLEDACYSDAPGLIPLIARSVARRIDSQVITQESVDKMITIIERNGWSISFREVILKFDKILEENVQKLNKFDYSSTSDTISYMVYGHDDGDIAYRINEALIKFSYLKDVDAVREDDEEAVSNLISTHGFPVHASLYALHQFNLSDDTFRFIIDEYKDTLYREMAENKFIYNFVKNAMQLKFVDWDEFDKFLLAYAGHLKVVLNSNKLSSPELDSFYADLAYEHRQKYGIRRDGIPRIADPNYSERGVNAGRDFKQITWPVYN